MSIKAINLHNRPRLNLSPAPTPEPTPAPAEATPAQYTRDELALGAIASAAPGLQMLVDNMQLADAGTGLPLRIPAPAEIEQNRAAELARLQAIAARALTGGRTYTRAEIIAAIMSSTGVPAPRAARGFVMFKTAQVIEQVNGRDAYHLAGQLPF